MEDILESVTKDQPGWTCDPCEVQQNNDPPSTNLVDLISIFNQRCGFPDVDDSKEPPGEEDSAAGSLDIFLAFNPSESELKISQMPDASDFGEPCDMAEILRELGVDQARHQPKPPDISGGLGRRQNKRDLVQLEHFVVQSMRLMVYQGQLCVYEEPCWKRLSDHVAETKIRAVLEKSGHGNCLTRQDYRSIHQNLLINPELQVEDELAPAEGKLNFLDGTFDLTKHRLYAHNPDDYFFTVIRVKYCDIKSCSGNDFETFVQQLSDGDPNVRQQLLELTALTILGKQVKYFYALLGESNTGKTQFGRFLEELVGRENVESVRGVHDFANQWTVGALSGKLLATCLDIPDTSLPKEAVGTIKQFVGDDPVKGERKNKNPFTFYRKPMLLFAGNHPIRIPNVAQEQALLNRMVVIPFRNPVSEQQMEQALYKKLLDEAPYIVGQALDAYEKLVRNNFQVTRSEIPPEYAPQEGQQEVQQALDFLEQHCRPAPNVETATADIYARYRQVVGDENALEPKRFTSILYKWAQKQNWVAYEKRTNRMERRGYSGLCLT